MTTTDDDAIAALHAFLEAEDDYDDDNDLDPEVITGDGLNYVVRFTLMGNGAWFSPNDARFFAYELTKAADEAEAAEQKARSTT
jgi:hypothetical protein